MVLIFGVGLGAWSTGQDLAERSGEARTLYRRYVRNWWPRWRPWCPSVQADFPEPRFYVPEGCLPSSSLSSWITERRPCGLSVVAADDHPTRDRLHLTFDPGDGTPPEEGVAAFARALEHIHLGWALVGWTMRLPLVKPLLQLLVYAVAGGPVQIVPAKNRERPSETEILKGQHLPKLPVDNEDIA